MDPMQNTTSRSEAQRHAAYTLWISILLAVVLAGIGLNAVRNGRNDQLLSIVAPLIAALSAIGLTGMGRIVAGSSMLIAAIGLHSILSPLEQSGLQPPTAIGALALIGCIGLVTMPRKYTNRVLTVGMIVAAISVLVDLFGPEGRAQAGSSAIRWGFALTLLILLIFFFSREFFSLNIRTKIVLGILATGGVAVGIFAIFAISQTAQVTTILSDRLETSVSLLAEEQLINSVYTQAELANESFSDVREEVESFA